jgi:hypothetical protein
MLQKPSEVSSLEAEVPSSSLFENNQKFNAPFFFWDTTVLTDLQRLGLSSVF